jgi:hypothetical protein
MAEKSSTSPLLEVKTSSSPHPGALNRLRKRFSKENKSSPNLLGVKIKRFSEFENYSGRSRGTLGGFSPLPDIGSLDIDSLCLEKQKNVEKECVLTQLTKKIGLGIYTRGRDTAAEKEVREGYVDMDGDERETWYMFYPPPPSPSLALEPKHLDSASSPEPDSVSSSSPDPIVVSEADIKPKSFPRLSAFTQGSDYATSNPTSPVSQSDHCPTGYETKQDIDIDALILSAENLAEQYRGLLLTPSATTRLTNFHPHSTNGLSLFPFLSPLSFHPPSRPQTPKTLRKIKRQHSLRKLLDVPAPIPIQHHLPSPTTPNTHLSMTTQKAVTVPNPLTPPPSATNPSTFPPVTPPLPALRSPDFLSNTVTPEPLQPHPTRLSLAAHPNRSPTPSQGRAKKRKPRGEATEAPEPPPRESSRGRNGRGGGVKERKKRKEVKGRDREGPRVEDENGSRRDDIKNRDRGRNEEMKRRGVSEEIKTGGGGVNEGGEGWL